MSMLKPVGNSFSPIKKHASILVGLRVWLNFCYIDLIYAVEMQVIFKIYLMLSLLLTHFCLDLGLHASFTNFVHR